ncbi:hypothetical protein [Leptothoe spongobia]|uniref:Uncharacterized protein n=1 Tax=Leptothoe spongobia TAU-MAC 1115 TaxID=1967444 RepID=A0A947DHD4_9CYAN|nr:hypothetical protein [Leptothoe spongobia]MBT9316364.1 hypothetical protein [Leptothoe spongobia TAU-MAC 1115]
MNNRPFNNQGLKVPRPAGRPRQSGIPWSLLALVLVLHVAVGIFLSVFSPPYWVWPLAFGGTLIQAFALAGPKALSALQGFRIILARAVTCLGTALSVVALAIAVGFGGTNDIDSIRFTQTGMAIFGINLGVLLLTAICSVLIAYIGDRLLFKMGRVRGGLIILSFCFLGMFMGGALGLAIAS